MIALLHGLAFVVFLFTDAQPDDEFGSGVFPGDFQRHDGDASGSCFNGPLADFAFVGKKDSGAGGVVLVLGACAGVFGNVDAVQGESWRVVFSANVPFLQGGEARSDRFDFGAGEFDAAGECVGNEEIEPCFAVLDPGLPIALVLLL